MVYHVHTKRTFGKRGVLPVTTAGQRERSFPISRKHASLVILVVQNSLLVLMMRYSRVSRDSDKPMYLASTAVFMAEAIKIVICFAVLLYQQQTWTRFRRCLTLQVFTPEAFKMLLPSGLYALQNNLLYIALSNLEAATFQITYQLKILSTAIFSVLMLRRTLNGQQWMALLLLMVGVTLVQIEASQEPIPDHVQNPFQGLVAVLASCVSSGFAGCYFERLLKSSETSMWVRNVQLAMCGALFSLIAVMNDLPAIRQYGVFQGYHKLAWWVILNQALGGLLVATVVKYADNILKGFATSISIILSSIISVYFFNFQPSLTFITGAAAVIAATYLYGKKPLKRHPHL